jgi:hypothetical protein
MACACVRAGARVCCVTRQCFSRVQKAKGMGQASCRQSSVAPAAPAASTSVVTRAWMAARCSAKGASVGAQMPCWMSASVVTRGGRSCSAAAVKRNAARKEHTQQRARGVSGSAGVECAR